MIRVADNSHEEIIHLITVADTIKLLPVNFHKTPLNAFICINQDSLTQLYLFSFHPYKI